MNRFLALVLLLCVSGCSFADPLGLMPKKNNNVTPVVVVSNWEDQAPDKVLFAKIRDIWLAQVDRTKTSGFTNDFATSLTADYHGLFAGMAKVVLTSGKLDKSDKVFTLLDNSRAAIGIAAGSCPDFSNAGQDALIAAGLENGGTPTDSIMQKVSDTFMSIACGCADAHEKLLKK